MDKADEETATRSVSFGSRLPEAGFVSHLGGDYPLERMGAHPGPLREQRRNRAELAPV
jgi:hypothetical protein